jgi:hypothetical protein
MPNLAELKNKEVVIQLVRPLLEAKSSVVKTYILDIEASGIWIEGSDLAEYLQKHLNSPLQRTPVFFVPFSQIIWIYSSADHPYLSVKSLGLDTP